METPHQDALIEAYKKDIDRTMIRESLRRTPQQRVEALIAMHRFVDEARRARELKKK